ncbi:hypothetical protein EGW08_013289, partial [Elysia chlorotica]
QPQPQPITSQVQGGRSDIPEGFSSYGEYIANMFANSASGALRYTNKIRGPSSVTAVRRQTDQATAEFEQRFLQEVVGYPSYYARQQQLSTGYSGIPNGIPTWLQQPRRISLDQDALDRLCAACYSSCRFSQCVWSCPQLMC